MDSVDPGAHGVGAPPSLPESALRRDGGSGTTLDDLSEIAPVSARRLARRLPAALPVPWLGLEVAAFARHPAVQDALDPRRTWRRRADRVPQPMLLGLSLLTLVGAVLVVTLLASEAVYGTPSVATTQRWTSATAVVSLVALLARLTSWVATRAAGRRPHTGDLALVAVVVVTVHGLATTGWLVSTRQWSPGIVVPLVATVAVAVIAVVVVVAVPEPQRPVTSSRRDQAAALAATLPERERRRVRRDVAVAIDVLERRGLADDAVLARARAAEPGALSAAVRRRS